MELWQRDALRRHRKAILDDLHVDYVLDHLISRLVLFEEHYESIFKESGRRNRARQLLDILPSLGPLAYGEFIASLQEPYSWLAEALTKESAGTAADESSSRQYFNFNPQQNQQSPSPDERTQMLVNMATVVANCGKCLTETSKVIMAIAQNNPDPIKPPNARVSRQNSINLAKNELEMVDAKEEITMDRLRGGGDGDSERMTLNTEKVGIPPSTLPLTDDSFAVTENIVSKTVVDVEKIDETQKVKKIIDSAYIYGDTVDGVYENGIIGEENSADLLNNLVRNKIDGVTTFEGSSEQFKTSGFKDEMCNDSPDSGISRDEIIGLEKEMSSLVILQQKNVDDGGEDFGSKYGEMGAGADDSVTTPPSGSSLKNSNNVVKPDLCDIQPNLTSFHMTLQESVLDIMGAVKNLVQISGRESKNDNT